MLTYHEPGIYPGMSEDEYRADPSLGSTDLKRLLISPLTYWIHSPHNPSRPEDDSTDATEYGTALHVRLLLGREEFYSRYAPKLRPEDFPGCIKSGDELNAKCKELGLKARGTNGERTERIRTFRLQFPGMDQGGPLWDDLLAEYEAEHEGCEQIPARWITNIELAAEAVEGSDETRERLTGGESEVAVFWRDPEYQTPLKARLDYHKTVGANHEITDVKSFANANGKQLEQAVASAVASYGYGVQACSYSAGVAALKSPERLTFTFLFINSGPVPNVLVRDFAEFVERERTAYWAKANRDFRHAAGLWKYSKDRFGLDRPWVDAAVRQPLTDDDFPLWSL